MITLKLNGVEAAISSFKSEGVKAEQIILKELKAFGDDIVTDAKRLAPKDEGHLYNSIANELKGNTLTVSVNADYAAYIEFGTKRFAAKYVATLPSDWKSYAAQFKGKGGGNYKDFVLRIMKWVKRKGIGGLQTKSGNLSKSKSSLDAMQQAAYGIALHIIRNGIKAQPFLYPAFVKNRAKLIKNLKAYFK